MSRWDHGLVGGSLVRPRIAHEPGHDLFRLSYGRHTLIITGKEILELGPWHSSAALMQWLYAKLHIHASLYERIDDLAQHVLRDPQIFSRYLRSGS